MAVIKVRMEAFAHRNIREVEVSVMMHDIKIALFAYCAGVSATWIIGLFQ